mgnify:CR=1 FL=1
MGDNGAVMTADPRFVIDPFEPAYLLPARRGGLRETATAAVEALRSCRCCPRRCEVNRFANEALFCRTGRHARISSAGPHYGEEECLRGRGGSGTIFFSMCNLRCVFCQNHDISQQAAGEEMTAKEIASLALDLQRRGCHNINFVTPEHVVPQVIEAIAEAVDGGLRLPIVYNTSAYDSLDSLRRLDGLIDLYMPDFKLWTPRRARAYLKAGDYPDRAREAIAEMHRQVGDLRFGPDGVARRGLLVRHLVMPGLLDEATAIFRWLAESVSRDTFVNIMAQYHPAHEVGRPARSGRSGARVDYPEIDRCPRPDEIEAAYGAARSAGLWRFEV